MQAESNLNIKASINKSSSKNFNRNNFKMFIPALKPAHIKYSVWNDFAHVANTHTTVWEQKKVNVRKEFNSN